MYKILYPAFLDLDKAFNHISWKIILQVSRVVRYPNRIIEPLNAMHDKTRCMVNITNQRSEKYPVKFESKFFYYCTESCIASVLEPVLQSSHRSLKKTFSVEVENQERLHSLNAAGKISFLWIRSESMWGLKLNDVICDGQSSQILGSYCYYICINIGKVKVIQLLPFQRSKRLSQYT